METSTQTPLDVSLYERVLMRVLTRGIAYLVRFSVFWFYHGDFSEYCRRLMISALA